MLLCVLRATHHAALQASLQRECESIKSAKAELLAAPIATPVMTPSHLLSLQIKGHRRTTEKRCTRTKPLCRLCSVFQAR